MICNTTPVIRTFVSAIFLFLTYFTGSLVAQEAGEIELVAVLPESSTYLSRYNMRVYENDSYQGLKYLEISGQIDRNSRGDFDSTFWQVSQTTRDLRSVVAGVDNVNRATFTLDELLYNNRPLSGSYPRQLYNFPEYRNFPVLPTEMLYYLDGPGIPPIGSSYEALGYRLVDPDGDGVFTPVQIVVRYTYQGTGEYLGERVHFMDADFALRSDGRLTGFAVQGSNDVRITIFPGEQTRIFLNNSLNEQYNVNGRMLRLQGFGLTWIRSPRPVILDPAFLRGITMNNDSPTRISSAASNSSPGEPVSSPISPSANQQNSSAADRPAQSDSSQPNLELPQSNSPIGLSPESESVEPEGPLNRIPGQTNAGETVTDEQQLPPGIPDRISSDGGDIELSANPLGLSLNLPDIQFVADSAELLPGELSRIEALVEILKQVPERRFLVVGHTADVGNPAGQQRLSVERARTVAEMLADRGIVPGSIRFEGRGASEPAADNATSQGRALNRRVEVIILN